jgi:L-lactate dehydrogenase (cytochrome)
LLSADHFELSNDAHDVRMTPARTVSFEDYRDAAKHRLPTVLYDYVDGGSYAEVTIKRNTADFAALTLRQRVMRDMSAVRLSSELFGQSLAHPVILGPVGFAGMLSRRGEIKAARAAAAAGVPFCLSTVSICSIEDVCAAVKTPPWFQLYMIKDRGFVRELLSRARSAGCPVLVLTVDLPTPGARYRDLRSGMMAQQTGLGKMRQLVDGLSHPRWLYDVFVQGQPHTFGNLTAVTGKTKTFSEAWDWIRNNFDVSVTWADLEYIRSNWSGPIVVKGILDPEDAKEAARAGADGIIVSNHGGRQLDGVESSVRVLPRVAEAVGDSLTILMDGGVRSGLDVLKALALGAKGCLLGKSWAFALAAGGERGVLRLLGTLRDELRVAMILTGCSDVRAAGPDLLQNS